MNKVVASLCLLVVSLVLVACTAPPPPTVTPTPASTTVTCADFSSPKYVDGVVLNNPFDENGFTFAASSASQFVTGGSGSGQSTRVLRMPVDNIITLPAQSPRVTVNTGGFTTAPITIGAFGSNGVQLANVTMAGDNAIHTVLLADATGQGIATIRVSGAPEQEFEKICTSNLPVGLQTIRVTVGYNHDWPHDCSGTGTVRVIRTADQAGLVELERDEKRYTIAPGSPGGSQPACSDAIIFPNKDVGWWRAEDVFSQLACTITHTHSNAQAPAFLDFHIVTSPLLDRKCY